MCDKAVDNFVTALKLVPDWFVLNHILEKRGFIFSNDDIDLDDIVKFFSNNMGIVTVDFINVNRHSDNFDEDDPETIFLVRLTAWCSRYKQREAYEKKIDKELMPIAWHLARVWDCCMRKNEKWNYKSNAQLL